VTRHRDGPGDSKRTSAGPGYRHGSRFTRPPRWRWPTDGGRRSTCCTWTAISHAVARATRFWPGRVFCGTEQIARTSVRNLRISCSGTLGWIDISAIERPSLQQARWPVLAPLRLAYDSSEGGLIGNNQLDSRTHA